MMQNNAKEIFAKNLQHQLQKSNKTQADLVRDLKYKQATVSDWVMGKKFPRVDKMQVLADYFSVSMSELMEEKPITVSGDELSQIKKDLIDVIYTLDDDTAHALMNLVQTIIDRRDK